MLDPISLVHKFVYKKKFSELIVQQFLQMLSVKLLVNHSML